MVVYAMRMIFQRNLMTLAKARPAQMIYITTSSVIKDETRPHPQCCQGARGKGSSTQCVHSLPHIYDFQVPERFHRGMYVA